MARLREVHGIVHGMFHSIVYKIISIIAAFSYKCFSVSWLKDITGNFKFQIVYFNVHLLMPGWYCRNCILILLTIA